MRRVIKAASRMAIQFADLYGAGDYERKRSVYEQMDTIMEKYGTPNDTVDVIYDLASDVDKKKLMRLAESLGDQTDDTLDARTLAARFKMLENKWDRDTCTEYERGYYEALCDVSELYNINL